MQSPSPGRSRRPLSPVAASPGIWIALVTVVALIAAPAVSQDYTAPRTADEAVRVCVRRTAQRASVVSVRGAEGIDPDEGTQRTANPPCRPPHPQPQGTRARRRQQIPKTAQDPPTSEAGTHGGATAVARAHRRRRWGETVTTATTATVTATTATMKTTTTTTATTAPDDAP